MEANRRWIVITAIAPVAWGTNYFVTNHFLLPDYPLWGAALRALPAGLILLAAAGRLPRGSWWWKSVVLGVLNVGAFFVLIYVAAQLLPTGIASTVMATSPIVMMLFAWALVAERPQLPHLVGAALGIVGVSLMLLKGSGHVDPIGLLASGTAMMMSSLGYILAKRWSSDVDVLASTSWQLVAGGLMLLPVAVLFEGGPPKLTGPAILGFGYVTAIATALAFAAWFAGLRNLTAATVGLIGLLNPITGMVLGIGIAGETLTAQQVGGLLLVLLGVLLGQPVLARRSWLVLRPRTALTAAPLSARSTTKPPAEQSECPATLP